MWKSTWSHSSVKQHDLPDLLSDDIKIVLLTRIKVSSISRLWRVQTGPHIDLTVSSLMLQLSWNQFFRESDKQSGAAVWLIWRVGRRRTSADKLWAFVLIAWCKLWICDSYNDSVSELQGISQTDTAISKDCHCNEWFCVSWRLKNSVIISLSVRFLSAVIANMYSRVNVDRWLLVLSACVSCLASLQHPAHLSSCILQPICPKIHRRQRWYKEHVGHEMLQCANMLNLQS